RRLPGMYCLEIILSESMRYVLRRNLDRQLFGKAGEKTSTCAVKALLRTRCVVGCLTPGFRIPLLGGLASAGQHIGSLRVLHRFFKSIAFPRTPQRLVGLYHARAAESSFLA